MGGPLHFCRKVGCNALIGHTGYCAAHEHLERDKQRAYDRGRSTALRRLYHSRMWRRLRLKKLTADPFCEYCEEDRQALATEVDHYEAVEDENDPRMWDYLNLRSACKRCHSRKTATDDGGFGNE